MIAGNTQRYVFTTAVAASGNAVASVGVFPALKQAYSDNAAITVEQTAGVQNMMFHRNAFALATAPLSTLGGELGARIATVFDDKTNLALRSRLYYDGDNSKVNVALDILYGFTTLDPNMAVRTVD